MTRCIISALMLLYALVKIAAAAVSAASGSLLMPLAVYIVAAVVTALLIAAGVFGLLGRAGATALRGVLLAVAVGAAVNMILLYMNPIPTGATVCDMLVSGTLFDALMFPLSFLVRIHRGRAISFAEVRRRMGAAAQSGRTDVRRFKAAGR